ncbi:MAG: putative lipid II flippase FtsW [Armatimonadetes bacterium]|nr:putative lipid II flippase FtsW [Armatimonadota bacterium]
MRKPAEIGPPNVWLLGLAVALVVIGVVFVFDASYVRSVDLGVYDHDIWYFAKRQLAYASIGLVCMMLASIIPVEALRKLSVVALIVCVMLLIMVLVPGIGHKVNGSRSWFRVGPLSFQPSELAKLVLILYLARSLGRAQVFARGAERRWLGSLIVSLAVIGLVVVEPDLGTAVVLSSIVFVMFAAAGAKKRWLVPTAVGGLALVYMMMCIVPHCSARVEAFRDPWAHRYDTGYQIVHSLIGFGTGGITGLGLCQGRVKSYLPAASTDYIYATIAEETGLVGSLALVVLFGAFAVCGFGVARKCNSLYGSLVASGITSAVSMQAIINMAVATNSIPATGLPMPFISYGGSSMVIMLTGVGLLLSISRQIEVELQQETSDEDSSYRRRHRRAHISGHQRGAGASRIRTYGRTAVRR